MSKYILPALLIFTAGVIRAQQLDVTADIRNRAEYRNGFGTLMRDTSEAAAFITQRARLVFDYRDKNLKLRLSPQNVRVWGDVTTTSRIDIGNSFHEAWGEAIANKYFSFKVGRQELDYDDQRIFGSVDWLMQARSHDALLFKFTPDTIHTVHIGLALNANKETNFKENYLVPQYKAMQFLWYHAKFKNTGLSFLLLNNGVVYNNAGKDKIAYSQTIGSRVTHKAGKFSGDAAAYLQSGKINVNNVNALYMAAYGNYKAAPYVSTGVGFEYLSGKDNNDPSTDIKSFNPFYGTNHKFNGYMDYFYVGNHINSVGLLDVYFNLAYEKNKFLIRLTPHYFQSAATLYAAGVKQDSHLGTEVDITLGYKLLSNISLSAGLSQMFATSSMEVLKGGNKSNDNNWGYLTVVFNPKIFSYTDTKK